MREQMGWLWGTRKIAVKGSSVRRFLQLCLTKGVRMWNLTEAGADMVLFEISNRNDSIVRELAGKCGVEIETRRRGGIPAFFVHSRKHLSFLCGILAAWLLVQGLGSHIWRIEIHGNSFYSTDLLQTFLTAEGYAPGIRRASVVCDDLEQLLRKEYARISWVSARVEGTCLILEMRESEAAPEEIKKTDGSLIAAADGIVKELTVRAGLPQVQIGDAVSAGQVLVDGRVPRYDDGKLEIGSEAVCADADIVLERTVTYTDEFSAVYPVRITDKKQKRSWVRAGTLQLQLPFLPFAAAKGEGQDSQSISRQVRVVGDFYLPVYYGETVKRTFIEQQIPYDKEELKKMIEKRLKQWIGQETENGKLVASTLQSRVTKTRCQVWGTVTVQDEAVLLEPLTESGGEEK